MVQAFMGLGLWFSVAAPRYKSKYAKLHEMVLQTPPASADIVEV